MNYIREINAFMDFLETNPMEASTQTLWFHLMAIANKSGWPEWFLVKNSLLEARIGLSDKSLAKHRNYLIQFGRIKYENRGKQKPGKYWIVPLEAEQITGNIPVNHPVKGSVNHPVNDPIKSSGFKEIKEIKENETKEATPTALPFESLFSAYKRVYQRELTPYQVQELGAYIDNDGIEEAVVVHAIERAALKGGGIGLVVRILNDYAAEGAKTLDQAKESDKQFDAPKRTKRAPSESGRPQLKVVKNDGQAPEVSPEEMERMLERARQLKNGTIERKGGEDNRLPFDRPSS
ncbi:DnaD domain protein [Paenibacillaceae bacterium WGS1546]|uniref:DnaD domain protein n=1 Tax=Cohnella sp. WGS1546 TaxID=3366810 RepID=UPI00372D2F7C